MQNQVNFCDISFLFLSLVLIDFIVLIPYRLYHPLLLSLSTYYYAYYVTMRRKCACALCVVYSHPLAVIYIFFILTKKITSQL